MSDNIGINGHHNGHHGGAAGYGRGRRCQRPLAGRLFSEMAALIVLTFEEALARANQDYKKCHALLGNGFSISCKPDIFTYGALFDRAAFPNEAAIARRAFDILETHDFEEVMRALRSASRLVRALKPEHSSLADELTSAVAVLREILVGTIAKQHPEKPSDIASIAYAHCRRFLSHFDNIYTLNYDLLLYWAIMQNEIPPALSLDDGFRTPNDGPAAYVSWEVEKSDQQNVYYLHGALHIFDAGAELQKFTWINTGVRLIDQIREALSQDLYPLVVAEGESHQKKAKVMHSGYLSRGYRSLPKVTGALFIFGHSLASNDDHILRLVERGQVKHVFVSLFGEPSDPRNAKIVARAQALARFHKWLKVDFYDAASANVWG
jgi:hypothetical protein